MLYVDDVLYCWPVQVTLCDVYRSNVEYTDSFMWSVRMM